MDESLEFQHLDTLIGSEVVVFLSNTKALTGALKNHDETVVLLGREGHPDTMVYKDHITTIVLNTGKQNQ